MALRYRMALTLLGLALTILCVVAATTAYVTLVVALGIVFITGEDLAGLPLEGLLTVAALVTLASAAWLVSRERSAPAELVAYAETVGTGSDDQRRRLEAETTAVAAQLDAERPRRHLVAADTPISLVTGYDAADAHLVVSTGLLERLDDVELRAVLAHELAHLKNRDAAVMTAASLPLVAFRRVTDLLRGRTAVRYGQTSHVKRTDALLAVGLVLVAPVWALAELLTASLSRAREFVADSAAATATGDPAALASALRAIDDDIEERPTEDFRTVASARSLAIVSPGNRLVRPLATHPPTDERVMRLREMAAAQESNHGDT